MFIRKAIISSLIFLGFSITAVADINSDENQPTISPWGDIEDSRIGNLEEEFAQAKVARLELDSLLSELSGMPLGTEKNSEALAYLKCELDEDQLLQAYDCNDNASKFAFLTFDSANQLVGAYFHFTVTDEDRRALITKFEDKLGPAQTFTKIVGPETSHTFVDKETQQVMTVEYPQGIPKVSWNWLDEDWEDWDLEIQAEGYSDLYVWYKSPQKYSSALAEAKGFRIYLDALYEFLDQLWGLLLPLIVAYVSYVLTENGWSNHHSAKKEKDITSFFADGRTIVFWCALVSLLVSAGGPVCESGDMFGCDYYSDDYREPMTGPDALKLFLELTFSAATGYWLAYLRWKK